ncbi:MAG: VWA domain-containing protein [Bacteroidia bacterium]
MKWPLSILFILLISLGVKGQELNKDLHDFGKIIRWNNPVAEFVYTNSSNETQLFLPIAYMNDLSVDFEKKSLSPGESAIISVRYYTQEFGKFERVVPIYVNNINHAINLKIKGKISSFHPEAFMFCPQFGQPNQVNLVQYTHGIKVVDSISKKTLYEYEMSLVSQGIEKDFYVKQNQLDPNGYLILDKFKPNLFQVSIYKDGYESVDLFLYMKRNGESTISLIPEEEILVYTLPDLSDDVVPMDTSRSTTFEEAPIAYVDPIVVPQNDNVPSNTKVDSSTFDKEGKLNENVYAFNHIVFVIDVSSSMDKEEKLPLLKYSMARMIEVLRPEDKVTIISYASGVNILASAVSGARKRELLNIVNSLSAQGQSFGSHAIDEAYNVAREQFIIDGNNEIILASDGIFNSPKFSRKRMYRKAKKRFAKENIRVSTVAFGKSTYALAFMQELAKNGNGSYIRIPDEQVASSILISNIMLHSRK